MSLFGFSWISGVLVFCILGGCGVSESTTEGVWPVLAQSEGGHFLITVQPQFDGVEVGLNRYDLSVFDADEIPVEAATVLLELWMPDHGHGSDREPAVEWREGAQYSVENVVYTMPGLWRWTLFIETEEHTERIAWAVDIR